MPVIMLVFSRGVSNRQKNMEDRCGKNTISLQKGHYHICFENNLTSLESSTDVVIQQGSISKLPVSITED